MSIRIYIYISVHLRWQGRTNYPPPGNRTICTCIHYVLYIKTCLYKYWHPKCTSHIYIYICIHRCHFRGMVDDSTTRYTNQDSPSIFPPKQPNRTPMYIFWYLWQAARLHSAPWSEEQNGRVLPRLRDAVVGVRARLAKAPRVGGTHATNMPASDVLSGPAEQKNVPSLWLLPLLGFPVERLK